MSSPSDSEAYAAPRSAVEAEIREKGSRFLAAVIPVRDEASAREALERRREARRGATHHCWAWRLGSPARERSADAGEPAGTAGQPILQALRGAGLSDALVVVSRWFGGTKLGRGGLARAYGAAARAALEGVRPVRRVETVRVEVELSYPQLGAAKRLLDSLGCRLAAEEYGETVRLEIALPRPDRSRVEGLLAELGGGVSIRRATASRAVEDDW